MISLESSGSTAKMEDFLHRMLKKGPTSGSVSNLDKYGEEGVRLLSSATPKETGLAGHSWTYEIITTKSGVQLAWLNTDVESGFPVAVMIQYGHGTGTGGYVQGRDYINPAMRPLFDKMVNEIWNEVTKNA